MKSLFRTDWDSFMDQQHYDRWWALHVRVVLGERLAEEDQLFYETAKKSLDEEEVLLGADQGVQETRATLAALEGENRQLRAQKERLDAEIVAVEEALDKKSRQLLGARK